MKMLTVLFNYEIKAVVKRQNNLQFCYYYILIKFCVFDLLNLNIFSRKYLCVKDIKGSKTITYITEIIHENVNINSKLFSLLTKAPKLRYQTYIIFICVFVANFF